MFRHNSKLQWKISKLGGGGESVKQDDHLSNPIQRTFAFDSCLLDDERRFLFLKRRFFSLNCGFFLLKVLKHTSEKLFVTTFVDKYRLTNVLWCRSGITTFQKMFQCSYSVFQRIKLFWIGGAHRYRDQSQARCCERSRKKGKRNNSTWKIAKLRGAWSRWWKHLVGCQLSRTIIFQILFKYLFLRQLPG